jgi:hypothetical protein
MVATTTIRHRQTDRKNHLKTRKLPAGAIAHAVRIIYAICGLAGSSTLIDDIRANLRADKVQAAIRHRDTAIGVLHSMRLRMPDFAVSRNSGAGCACKTDKEMRVSLSVILGHLENVVFVV